MAGGGSSFPHSSTGCGFSGLQRGTPLDDDPGLRDMDRNAMTTVSEKVLEETKRFRASLPELLKVHPGKWIVFLNGAVQSVHDDETSAFESGRSQFGVDAGYVIAPVVEVTPTPVTASVMFGLSYA